MTLRFDLKYAFKYTIKLPSTKYKTFFTFFSVVPRALSFPEHFPVGPFKMDACSCGN